MKVKVLRQTICDVADSLLASGVEPGRQTLQAVIELCEGHDEESVDTLLAGLRHRLSRPTPIVCSQTDAINQAVVARYVQRLREAGIKAGINCMPVLPGITDNPSDLDALVKRVSEAGATYVGACAVRLQSEARKRYLPFIQQEFPHLAERYRNTYGNSSNAGEKYREGLARFFEKLCAKYGVRGWTRRDQEEGDESPDSALVPSVQLSFEI